VVADEGPLRVAVRSAVLLAVGAVLVVGCGVRPLYRWGHYEELVYQMYAEPGKAEPGVQVEKLTRDIAQAASEGKPVPPGVHLHLGYMYLQQGNAAAARHALEVEKRLFPESTVFVDHLLARLGVR
jgi:hypothetical protein